MADPTGGPSAAAVGRVRLRGLVALFVLGYLSAPVCIEAQRRIEDDIRRLSVENARGFVEPLTRGLFLAMGGGLFDGAAPLEPLAFELGARVSTALPPRRVETFEPVAPSMIVWDEGPLGGTFTNPYGAGDGASGSPTVTGRGPGTPLQPVGEFRTAIEAAGLDPSSLALPLPGGHDLPAVPHPLFHASLGIGLGTELSVRYLPDLEVDEEIGAQSGYGVLARHSLTRWIDLPLDVSLLAAVHEMEIGGYLDVSSTRYGLLASHRMGPLSVFASGFLRSGSATVTYIIDNPEGNPGLPPDGTVLRFTDDFASGTGFGLGARIQLLVLNLAGQYTFEAYPVVTLKVGFGTP